MFECQSEMSDKAPACPKCGNPNKLKKDRLVGAGGGRSASKKWKLVKLVLIDFCRGHGGIFCGQ